jgi:hypothetical protein
MPGGAKRAGNGDAMVDVLTLEALRQIGGQPGFAAPQMGATGDLDLDAVMTAP